jgi:hypothetical protein
MYADVISKNTEKGHTMHEDWTEQDHFPDGTTYLGIGPENEDDDLVLLAPITTDEGAPYGVYFSGNPAIVFGRLHLPYVLSLAPAEAVAWLLNDLTDAERHRGEPFYVRGTR